MVVSFAAVGMLLGALGPALSIDADSVRTGGAMLMLAFAAVMLVPALRDKFSGWIQPMVSAAHHASVGLEGQSPASALALSAVLGLVWLGSGPSLLHSRLMWELSVCS